ncbi:MAG: hypothetical protein ACOX5Z_09020 [Desulfobulbus sp.]|jgi:hypothetical protein
MIRVCCMCQRLEWDGVWVEAIPPQESALTHGLCPTCFDEAMENFRKMQVRPAPETCRAAEPRRRTGADPCA